MVSIGFEMEKFLSEGVRETIPILLLWFALNVMLKPESDVSGGLNNGLNDLCDVFMFVGKKMIAKNGLLEFVKSQRIGNKGFASGKIDGDAINLESCLIMNAQMRNRIEHDRDCAEILCDVIIPCFASHEGVLKSGNLRMKLNKEARINFPSTQDISGIARHTAGMIFPHPLQVVRIVSASFKFAGIPRPKAFALSAEHLITSLGFVNGNFAIRARFGVVLEKSDRSKSVGIANMKWIIAIALEFAAV